MREIKQTLFLILIFSINVLNAQNIEELSIAPLLKKAETSIQKRDYQQAIATLQQANEICPNCLMPYYKLAVSNAELGNFAEADKALNAAYKISPTANNNIWFGALVKSKKGLFDECLADVDNMIAKQNTEAGKQNWNKLKNILLTRKLAFHESKVSPILDIAQYYFNNKDYDSALVHLDNAISQCPICAEPHFKKAMVLGELNQFKQADEELAMGSVASIGVTQSIRYSSLLKAKKGNIDGALADIQQQINNDTSPRILANWYGLKAEIEMKEKRYVDAYKDNCKAYELNPKSKHTLYLMMLHEIHTKQKENFSKHFEAFTLENANIDTPRFYYDKGYLFYEIKDYKNALSLFEQANQLQPRNVNAIIMKAVCKALLDPKSNAIDDADYAIKLRPKSAGLLNNRGFIKILTGNYTDALTDLFKAIELNPKEEQAYNNIGYIYYKMGGKDAFKKALEYYNKAVEIGGNGYEPYWKYKNDIEKMLETKTQ